MAGPNLTDYLSVVGGLQDTSMPIFTLMGAFTGNPPRSVHLEMTILHPATGIWFGVERSALPVEKNFTCYLTY